MAKHTVVDEYPVPAEAAFHMISSVVAALRWRLKDTKQPGSFSVLFNTRKSLGNTTKLTVQIIPRGDSCQVKYDGRLFGVGPLIAPKLRKTIEELREPLLANLDQNLRMMADAAVVQAARPRSTADALRELEQLRTQGFISDDEFLEKRAAILERL